MKKNGKRFKIITCENLPRRTNNAWSNRTKVENESPTGIIHCRKKVDLGKRSEKITERRNELMDQRSYQVSGAQPIEQSVFGLSLLRWALDNRYLGSSRY